MICAFRVSCWHTNFSRPGPCHTMQLLYSHIDDYQPPHSGLEVHPRLGSFQHRPVEPHRHRLTMVRR